MSDPLQFAGEQTKPIFYLLSGPPGAGKSSSGTGFAPYEIEEVLDFDKVRLAETKDYQYKNPSVSFEEADSYALYKASTIIHAKIDEALDENKSVGMESMIWDERTWKTAQSFQDGGYRFELTYIGLASADVSVSRVEDRIESGGHSYVSGELATTCYNANLQKLNEKFTQPDQLDLYDNTGFKGKFIAVLVKGEVVNATMEKLPDWVKKSLPAIAEKIERHQSLFQNNTTDQKTEKKDSDTSKPQESQPKKEQEQKRKGFRI